MGRFVDDFLLFFFVFNYPMESPQESCEKLGKYKEKLVISLQNLRKGSLPMRNSWKCGRPKEKNLTMREARVGGLSPAGVL